MNINERLNISHDWRGDLVNTLESEERAEREVMGGVADDEAKRHATRGSTPHNTAVGRHAIRTSGAVTWCDVCGAYAAERAGTRLMVCRPKSARHTATRLERSRKGLCPITEKEWGKKEA